MSTDQSAKKSGLTQRLANLKEKTAELVIKEVKVPPATTDILTTFEANSAAKTDQTNEWILDVFPNFVPILCYVMALSHRYNTKVDHRESAKSTAATITLYNMALIYGFFLLNDLFVRPFPSAHARTWSLITNKKKFAEFLLSLPVPDDLHTVFSQLYAAESERTKNVFFVPSAAGFNHHIHFGRFFPLLMFAAIHDCSAEMPSNSKKEDILTDLFSRDLYTCYNNSTDTPANFSCSIADLLGYTASTSTASEFAPNNSKLFQSFQSIFNPVLFRDYQRRSSLASLSLIGPIFKTSTPNCYDLLFGYTPDNLRELKVVLQSVSSVLTGQVKMSKNLGQLLTDASGTSILEHGYSTFALPTWSSNPKTSYSPVTKISRAIESEAFATKLTFLQKPESIAKGKRPTTSLPLGIQNCQFADSAIPVRYCIPGIAFYPRADKPLQHVLRRSAPGRSSRLKASSFLVDRSVVPIPNLDYLVRDTPAPTVLPGYTQIENVNWITHIQRFLGFKTCDNRDRSVTDDNIVGMTRKIYLWSPYTYTPVEDDDDMSPDLSASRTYFISNLRTFFGTDVNLVEVKHALEAIPIA